MFKIQKPIIEGGYLKLSVEAGDDYWNDLREKAFDKLISSLELKGFRKGKVPLQIAKQSISKNQIWNEAISFLIDEKLEEINEEITKENIISRPILEVEKISDDEVIVIFSAPLMPNVELENLERFQTTIESFEATKEEIEEELKKIDSLLVENKEVDDAIKNGDIANINFLGTVDGEEFEGGKADNYDLEIGSKSFIETFEEQLIGLKTNDEKVVKVTFPETYPVEKLANKPAEFKVKINSVKRKVSLSEKEVDEKVKGFGFENLISLKESIEANFIEQKKMQAYNNFMKKIIASINDDETVVIDIPKELIQQETENKLETFKKQLEQSQIKLKDYLKMISKSEQDFIKEDIEASALNALKEQIVFEAIDKKLNFEVTDEEVEAKYLELSDQQKLSVEELKEQIKATALKQELRFIKLVDFFIKN